MSDTGCEVIAVYNAMILSGMEDVSLADTIEVFQDEGALISQNLFKGFFGSNPYKIDDVLEEVGLQYHTINSMDNLDEGMYIVSFWNGSQISDGIHTFTIEVSATGEIEGMYNGYKDNVITDERIFITGYKIENAK